jgi:hypothetical protein
MNAASISGILASAAGAPLAQTKGSEIDRRRLETDRSRAAVESERRVDTAAGVAEADGEQNRVGDDGAGDRPGWEHSKSAKRRSKQASAAAEPTSRDATGQSGNEIDLCG